MCNRRFKVKKLLLASGVLLCAGSAMANIYIDDGIQTTSYEFKLSPGARGGISSTKYESHKMTDDEIRGLKKKGNSSITETLMFKNENISVNALTANYQGKRDTDITLKATHKMCFNNFDMRYVVAGYRFTLASMNQTALSAEQFWVPPHYSNCFTSESFLVVHPLDSGTFPVTAYSVGTLDGQNKETHNNGVVTVS